MLVGPVCQFECLVKVELGDFVMLPFAWIRQWKLSALRELTVHQCDANNVKWLSRWIESSSALERLHVTGHACPYALTRLLTLAPSLSCLTAVHVGALSTVPVDPPTMSWLRQGNGRLADVLAAKGADLGRLILCVDCIASRCLSCDGVIDAAACVSGVALSIEHLHLSPFVASHVIPSLHAPTASALRWLAGCACGTLHIDCMADGDTMDEWAWLELYRPFTPLQFDRATCVWLHTRKGERVPPVLLRALYPRVVRVRWESDQQRQEGAVACGGVWGLMMRVFGARGRVCLHVEGE
ncbi:unnamed protein product [Vitrella brassicaformis CCMP3155]|uniref:Uncharacterized protein n=1 Tax=Vitrella brassicaformis (strain CCMP3155) TaxID=1169540 RepID=A0A0G4EQZ2_VITBC|nr:unnamed protein product [Vitrella brassicaformis CCMP3155]|mmetsp:Transcript_13890/g.39965  ORF Transcript_13890/g.39965 Transcript_13890/m.39965 type:complete len:297 (-) Transcript_13890:1079-1969(-)|eukprot:CEM00663.1 unnamed protein product [Vitrella brassicaformis CCMP3155]